VTDFSSIAQHYDLMTGYSKRLINDFGVIKHLVETCKTGTALDAGCGTGIHSIILGKLGVDVIGLDSSSDMIERARVNALREGIELQFVQEYFEAMPLEWSGRFDTVFCLANSLVGVETGERLSLAFRSFQRVLKPGGRLIIQLLNFIHFRRTNTRIIKVTTEQNFTFVRFFDFEKEVTRLNVLTIEHDLGQVKYKLMSEAILPVNTEVIAVAAKMNGFSEVEFYSDLSLGNQYRPNGNNLVAVVTK
jgi:ubiquinone/menaquinone biosynthesis C-methylase UbiE